MRDVEHDYRMSLIIDPVTDPLVLATARGVLACVLIPERVAYPVWIVQQWADDELRGGGGDLLGKSG